MTGPVSTLRRKDPFQVWNFHYKDKTVVMASMGICIPVGRHPYIETGPDSYMFKGWNILLLAVVVRNHKLCYCVKTWFIYFA